MRISRSSKKCLLLGVFLLIHMVCLLLIAAQTYMAWRSSDRFLSEDQTVQMKQFGPNPVSGQLRSSRYQYFPKTAVNTGINPKLNADQGPSPKPTIGRGVSGAPKTTVNTDVAAKLEGMMHEMNASQVSNGAVYPAKRIGSYLWLNPNLCSGVALVDIIIIVHTAPANLERRQRIRDTFGHEPSFLPFHVRVAFMLGKTMNVTLAKWLRSEHVTHKDTVMGDFIDDYHNLTLKGVMGFRWVGEYCGNSKFVLKIDDDVMINMYKLLYSFLNYMGAKSKSIFCNLWHRDRSQILRDGKWKVDPRIFARRQTYPYDYCSGFSVILTSDLMRPMVEAANTSPFFWIDDVYLFGMLPIIVGQVTYYNFAMDKNITKSEALAINCTRSQGPRCPIYASLISDETFWPFWKMISDIYTTSFWHLENKTIT
ncbi:unnamed protein product [Lymnaea stagnalis]|uniref:Hexosyltransferase n=1 Tax=Lymnaea stagnalis TaxID=6523 RepID=A0AAV2H150_LYMST